MVEVLDRPSHQCREVSQAEVDDLLQFWNTMGVIKHRKDGKQLDLVKKRLSHIDTNIAQIKIAIQNYSTITNDPDYFFDHKWTISEFLSIHQGERMYTKFLQEGSRQINYQIHLVNTASRALKKERADKFAKANLPIAQLLELGKIDAAYESILAEFRFMDYNEYLKTKHWKHFKIEALTEAHKKCHMCNSEDPMLFVHHRTYDNRGRETFNDVIVLCGECHAKFHDKE